MGKIEFETFRDIGHFEITSMTQKEPSCFNGMVRATKYRITIEEVEEPVEVIHARIQKMWDECKNSHHRQPLKAMAKKYGLEL